MWRCHGECRRILTPSVHSRVSQLLSQLFSTSPNSALNLLNRISKIWNLHRFCVNPLQFSPFPTQLTSTLGWSFIGQKLRVRFCITYAGHSEESWQWSNGWQMVKKCHAQCHVSWRIHSAVDTNRVCWIQYGLVHFIDLKEHNSCILGLSTLGFPLNDHVKSLKEIA